MPSLTYVLYAMTMLFIALASKEILVADPSLLVAITFLIFSFVSINKLGPLASDFFNSQEELLKSRLTSSLDSFKQEAFELVHQEEVLSMLSSVCGSAGIPVGSVGFDPVINGSFRHYLATDYSMFYSQTDLLSVYNNFSLEHTRRFTKFTKLFKKD